MPNRTGKSTEILLAFDAENRTEIDETAKKIISAGDTFIPKMLKFKRLCIDLGGHRWSAMYMDTSKLPK